MDLALLGFLTIGAFLSLILFARAPVIVALVLVPVAAAIAGGFAGEFGMMAVDGLRTVAPICALLMFAVLYFGLMLDVGLFEPLIRLLAGLVRDDPVRLCIISAILPLAVALDGDGATTFLVSITALLPMHRRLRMNPLVLPAIVCLAAGVMNILPWGGPVARAMTVLKADVSDIFLPVLPAMLAGIVWVFFAAWMIGLGERKRLAAEPPPPPEEAPADPVAAPAGRANGLFWFNLILTVLVVVLLFQDIFASAIGLPSIPAPLLFMVAFSIALPVNRRGWPAQQAQLASHAASALLVSSMILAAGVFTGVLNGTGMIQAMAKVLADSIPHALSPWMSGIVAITGMPLSLVFNPDAYYFGVLPVFAQTAAEIGHDPLTIGRAAVLGQMTTGFPLSPMTASTFILIGLSEVTLRDHQRFVFLWAFGTTVVMTVVAMLTGAL